MNDLEGIIYKVMPYGETSKLLFTYTKEGKITLHARGSQKLNSSLLIISQYLTKINFKPTKNKTFYNLSEPKLLNEYQDIKSDYNLTKDVSIMLELINRCEIDDIYHTKVYNLLNQALDTKLLVEAVLSFSVKLLYFLGIGPNLDADGRNVLGFNISQGSIVYEGEDHFLDLNLNETIILLKLAFNKINALEPLKLSEIKVIKNFVYYYYLDKLDLKIKALT